MREPIEGSGTRRAAWVAAAAVVAWGIVLLVCYLAAHPELGDLAAGAAHADGPGPVAAAGRAAAGAGVAAAILLACWGFGRAAGRLVPPAELNPVLVEAARFALGTAIGGVALFAAGHAGLLTRGVAVALAAVGVGCLLATARGRATSLGSGARSWAASVVRDRGSWPWIALVAAATPWPVATALAPPTARDALIYHLAAPKAYIAAGSIVELPANVHSYTPFSTEMLFTWALLLGSEPAAQLLHLLFGAVCLAVLYAIGAEAGGAPRWGALAAALFATVPSVGWTAGIAHNEMVLCLATTVAFLVLAAWFETGQLGAMLWFGAALGLALSAKHTLLVMGPVFALVVLVRLRTERRAGRPASIVPAAAAAVVALLLPAPWYVQNAAWTGNPLYPYFWDAFPTHHAIWNADRAAMLDQFIRMGYGRGGGALAAMSLPWDVSVLAQSDVPGLFDGALGPAFLFLAPLVAWAIAASWRALEPRWRIAFALVLAGLVTWASQSQQVRFLLPFVPSAALVAVVALSRPAIAAPVRRAATSVIALLLAANVAVAAAEVVRANPFAVAAGLESREAYLTRSLAYYTYYAELARVVPPGGRVWLVNTRADTYNLDVPAYSDTFDEDWTIGAIVNAAKSPDEVEAAIRARGVTHLLVREEILMSPSYTPFDGPEATARWVWFIRERTTALAREYPYAIYALNQNRER